MRLYWLANLLATGLYVAYLTPYAKATLASAVTVAAYYPVASTVGQDDAVIRGTVVIIAVAVVSVIGVWASRLVAEHDEEEDPGRVVIDEVAGQLLVVAALPLEAVWMFAAFVAFRLLDIVKPLGIKRLEQIGNGVGIMLDDLAAGLVAAIVLSGGYYALELLRP